MERWGDFKRSTNSHYFCDRLEDQIDLHPNARLVISDVRRNPAPFENIEPLLLMRLGGRVWGVERPNAEAGGHVTNEPLASDYVSLRITNSDSISTLQQLVDMHVAAAMEQREVAA
jgi:hypothetical protein